MTLLSAICAGLCCLISGLCLGFIAARAFSKEQPQLPTADFPALETLLTLDRIPELLREAHHQLQENCESFSELEAGNSNEESAPPIEKIQSLIEGSRNCSLQLLRGAATLKEQMAGLETFLREARTDPLTGLWNRRAFDENLKIQFLIAHRYDTPFSIALFDLDHFKQINDRHGHPVGDEVLRQFAKIMLAGVRGCDVVTRYGGEEFAILLPQTDLDGAITLAERIRSQIEASPIFVGGQQIPIQTSAGVATSEPGEDQDRFFARADAALYHAKRVGRNCIHVHHGGSIVKPAPQLLQ